MTKNNIFIRNLSPERSVIDIEGTIGVNENLQFNNPGSRVATYEKLTDALLRISEIEAPEVVVNIRSTGGDVNDALLIYEALKSLPGRVVTCCYGYTASAATVIAQAASAGCRRIASGALYLIHNSICATEGNVAELEASTDLLRKTDERLAALYAERSGVPVDRFTALMAENNGAGRWLSPAEAVEAGLADEVIDDPHREASDDNKSAATGNKETAARNRADSRIEAISDGGTDSGAAGEENGAGFSAEAGVQANMQTGMQNGTQNSTQNGTQADTQIGKGIGKEIGKTAKNSVVRSDEKPVTSWRTLIRHLQNLFAGKGRNAAGSDKAETAEVRSQGFGSATPPVDKNIFHMEDPDPLREMIRSRIAFSHGQNSVQPTATLPVEDPAAYEYTCSANERAYAEDARRMRM